MIRGIIAARRERNGMRLTISVSTMLCLHTMEHILLEIR